MKISNMISLKSMPENLAFLEMEINVVIDKVREYIT
jgi:hypothetical protein